MPRTVAVERRNASELFKGSGDPTLPSGYRGILVSDGAGKALHAWHRSQLLPHFLRVCRPNMCGGAPNRGTDLCAQTGRAWWGYTAAMGLSAVELYVDVVGAFDAVCREVLWQGTDDESIARLISRMGFDPSVMHALAGHVADKGYLSRLGVPGQVIAGVRQSHDCSWFSTQGLGPVVHSRAGSKPGDPLGDIVFNFLGHRVLECAQRELDKAGLLDWLPEGEPPGLQGLGFDEPCSLLETNYVDDSLFFLATPTAAQLVKDLTHAARVIKRTCAHHAMHLNWKAGKTEAMLAFRGEGARGSAIQFHIIQESGIPVDGDRLRAVSYYKHMGTCSRPGRSLVAEAKHRIGSMFSQYRPIRRSVLSHSDWPVATRLIVVNSRLFPGLSSRLVSGARTPGLPKPRLATRT